MAPRFAEPLLGAGRPKPRTDGLTMVLDRWANDPGELSGPLAEYVDVVKIGWGIPALVDEEAVRARVARYRASGIEEFLKERERASCLRRKRR